LTGAEMALSVFHVDMEKHLWPYVLRNYLAIVSLLS
jgi:hypothetical protein